MRITGGRARGIPLKAPKGDLTRPATDRIREAIFSSLGLSVEGCKVADLFAGTGSYGLEALSRGAASVTFFEMNRPAISCLRNNIRSTLRSCKLDTTVARVIERDVFTLENNSPAYDLIFLDPPYEMIESNLARIFEKGIGPIALESTRVVLELPGNLEPEIDGWELSRRIGKKGKDKPTAAIFQSI